jgi:putative acetyltransferase
MSDQVNIRSEHPDDAAAIDPVLQAAFGRENEAVIVRTVRSSTGYIPELSLVADLDGQVVGHILLSAIEIQTPTGSVPSLALAPVAVHPDWQNRGIGSALVREGLNAAGRLGHTSVIVLGHPGFYRRFGFRPAAHRGIQPPFPVPKEAFLVLELAAGALTHVRGTVRYPAIFEAD